MPCNKRTLRQKAASILVIVVTMTSFPLKKLGFMTVRIMQGLGQYQPEHPIFHSDHTVQNLSELVELFSKKG